MEYKNKRHQELLEYFIKKEPIVECMLSGEGEKCVHDCNQFYNCWVKDLDEKEIKAEISKTF